MELLALTLPGQKQAIKAPGGIPEGGLDVAGEIFSNALVIFISITIIVTLVMLVWSGFQWITSGGDKEKIQRARLRLTFAITGLVLVLVSYLIVNALGYFFGVDLLKFSK